MSEESHLAELTPEQGMRVPEVLRPYIPGNPEVLPYVKELPKDSTSQKLAKR